jgi:hypothetical protein
MWRSGKRKEKQSTEGVDGSTTSGRQHEQSGENHHRNWNNGNGLEESSSE